MVQPCFADVASCVITSRLYRQKNLCPANFSQKRRFPHARQYRIKDPAQCVQGCGRNSSSVYLRRISVKNADFRTPGSIASKTLLNVYRAAAGIRARSISGEFHKQTPISAREAVRCRRALNINASTGWHPPRSKREHLLACVPQCVCTAPRHGTSRTACMLA